MENIYRVFPVQNTELYNFYLHARNCFWIEKEIDFSKDYKQWENLNENEKYFLSNILSFFAQSDQIVNINLDERFLKDIETLPKDMIIYTKFFYHFQISMEDIHTITYETMLDTYIHNKEEQNKLKNGIKNIPCIEKKAKWAFKWIDDKNSSFTTRLIAFASLEGIFFSGSFAAIFWMKGRNLLEGLTKSNEFIARDEGLHRDFACILYKQLKKRDDYNLNCSSSTILEIIKEAVEIEKEFITKSFKCDLIGMNPKLMKEYIEFIADNLLQNLDEPKYYNTKNSLLYMENIGLENKTNFFESRPTEYSKANSFNNNTQLSILDDF